MTTAVSLCNRALNRIGLKTIAGFGENSDKARTCDLLYPGIRDALLSQHPWRFATGKSGELNRLAATPTNEWKYAYQLPTDLLSGPYAVFNSNQPGALTTDHFEIFEDLIYTSEEKILIDYRFRPPEAKFRPLFSELLVHAVAAAIAPILTDKTSLAELYHKIAYGAPSENMRGGLFAVAALDNAQNNSANAIEANDLVAARFS